MVNFTRTFTLDVDSSKTNTSENSTEKNPKAAKKSTENHTDGQFDLFATPGTGILSGAEVASGFKTIKNIKHFYQHIDSPLSRKLFLKKLMQQHSVCFDTETTGLKALEVELIGIAFSYEVGKGYYVSFPENQEETASNFRMSLEPFFENQDIEKIAHNLKYDIKVLSNYDIARKRKIV